MFFIQEDFLICSKFFITLGWGKEKSSLNTNCSFTLSVALIVILGRIFTSSSICMICSFHNVRPMPQRINALCRRARLNITISSTVGARWLLLNSLTPQACSYEFQTGSADSAQTMRFQLGTPTFFCKGNSKPTPQKCLS